MQHLKSLIRSSNSLLKVKHNEWPTYNGQIIKSNTVLLSTLMRYTPYDVNPKFLCSTLFVEHCDKNWLYYHLTNQSFPLVQELFLNSSPDDQIRRLMMDFPKVFLTEPYAKSSRVDRFIPNANKLISYKKFDTSNTLQIITEKEYNRRLQEYI
jgi:hypothetical protein